MSQTVRDARDLTRRLRQAAREARRLGQDRRQTGTVTGDIRSISDAIARQALAGLQSRGLVE